MSKQIEYAKSQIIEVLRHVNGIVVSLDRIGAAHADMTPDLWREAVVKYFLESQALKSLANCRAILSAPFSTELGPDNMDELEREMADAEYWSYSDFLRRRSDL